MKWFRKKEKRQVSVSSDNFFELLGFPELAAGVTIQAALGVPAVWAAVQFLSSTIAGLPLQVFRKTNDGRKKIETGLAKIINENANDEMTSFDWLKYNFEQVFTSGRGYTFIERKTSGVVVNLWPLEPSKVVVKRSGGRTTYTFKDGGREIIYQANEIIDIPFMLSSDMISSRSPIFTHKEVIGKAIEATKFGAKIFQNGGVPPYALIGAFRSKEALERASEDMAETMARVADKKRPFLPIPKDHEVKPLGLDPEKLQLEKLQRFMIEEVARIYSIPPIMLQDLTHGTFSNTEQQDLHLVKHTIKRWVEQTEAQMNLKLFGRNSNLFVEFNLDGLLRGDIKSRYEAYAKGIQNAFLLPDQVRAFENFESVGGKAGELFIQGATVPLNSQTGENNGG